MSETQEDETKLGWGKKWKRKAIVNKRTVSLVMNLRNTYRKMLSDQVGQNLNGDQQEPKRQSRFPSSITMIKVFLHLMPSWILRKDRENF
jgi:hypothetical protein